MNDLFASGSGAAAFRPDDETPAHSAGATVRRRRDDLAGVLRELDDVRIVVVIEGPNRTDELQLFFDTDVAGDWKTYVQPSKGQTQCIGIAVRTDGGDFADPPFEPFDTGAISAFDAFTFDSDSDGIDETYRFERRPLYVKINLASGAEFRVLGLHLKSKGIFAAYEWSKWWQIADANRRKLLAQATQLRVRFIDPYLRAAATSDIPLLVCGDINDGPGLDASEKRLFGSTVERLMGLVWNPELCLRNALFETLTARQQEALDYSPLWTASFSDPIFNNTWHREWIDHVLYSQAGGRQWVANAQIHRRFGNVAIWDKYKHASDHMPVSVEVSV